MSQRPSWNGRGVQAAKNPQIEINMDNIATFDQRLMAATGARDRDALLELAAWAYRNGLTLGHKAISAADGMVP